MVASEATASQAAATASKAIEQVGKLREEIVPLKKGGSDRFGEAQFYRVEMWDLHRQLETQEGYSRRFNLIIQGIPENDNENDDRLYVKVRSFINNNIGITDIGFDICHRLGLRGNRGDERDRRVG